MALSEIQWQNKGVVNIILAIKLVLQRTLTLWIKYNMFYDIASKLGSSEF